MNLKEVIPSEQFVIWNVVVRRRKILSENGE